MHSRNFASKLLKKLENFTKSNAAKRMRVFLSMWQKKGKTVQSSNVKWQSSEQISLWRVTMILDRKAGNRSLWTKYCVIRLIYSLIGHIHLMHSLSHRKIVDATTQRTVRRTFLHTLFIFRKVSINVICCLYIARVFD